MNIQNNSILQSKKRIKQKNHLFSKYQYLLVFIITIAITMIFTNQVLAEDTASSSNRNIETIYHVHYDNERVGIINDESLIEKIKDSLLEKFSQDYEDFDFTIKKNIVLIPELVFEDKSVNGETLELLSKEIEIHAKTHKLTIGDHLVAHINHREDVEQLIRQLKLDFISEEELELYESTKDEELTVEVGDSQIIDIHFSEELQWESSTIQPDKILTVKEVLQMLQKGTLEEETYTVQQGDVLGAIAARHDLSTEDLLSINENMEEDSLLQVGDELKVTFLKPMLTVIVEKAMKKEEKIPFKTETKEDNDMWKGNTKITQEGKQGKKIINYSVTYENGRSVKQEAISEDVVQEPVTKVIVKGTKSSPSRGTGQLAWPAVGGYISSQQGTRWGRFHKGIDIARPSNYNILAADNGTVKSAGWENGYGNTVRINHNNGIETIYAHLANIDVKSGQTVGKGQRIGKMGTTGNSTGIHLHFEVYQNGKLKNPMDFLNR